MCAARKHRTAHSGARRAHTERLFDCIVATSVRDLVSVGGRANMPCLLSIRRSRDPSNVASRRSTSRHLDKRTIFVSWSSANGSMIDSR